jgi:hypothetical protein
MAAEHNEISTEYNSKTIKTIYYFRGNFRSHKSAIDWENEDKKPDLLYRVFEIVTKLYQMSILSTHVCFINLPDSPTSSAQLQGQCSSTEDTQGSVGYVLPRPSSKPLAIFWHNFLRRTLPHPTYPP